VFIAVDLKVIEGLAGSVARASGTSEDAVLAGLLRTWHRCWSDEIDILSAVELAGLFSAPDQPLLASALESFGFIEPVENGSRIRGAARYLRLKESRRRGATLTNEKRALERRSKATLSDAPATLLSDALSPSHRVTEKKKPASQESKRNSDLLAADFKAAVGSEYLWNGAKDGVALAELLKASDIEEVRRRWRIGLKASGWSHVATVAQLRSKWNDLASEQPAKPTQPKPTVRPVYG